MEEQRNVICTQDAIEIELDIPSRSEHDQGGVISSKEGRLLLGNIRKPFRRNGEIRMMCKEMDETSEIQLEIS